VRLIDQDGEQLGVVSLVQARRLAEDAELDLVEISPNAKPPVCRIMDYGKYRFEQAKKQQEARKKLAGSEEKTKADPGQGDQIPSRYGRRGLSGQTTQPDPFPERWR